MIGLVFISVYDIFLLLHEEKFHQILYILCLDRPWERKGLAPSSDEPSKKFPVISHASVNFKLREKKWIHKRAQSGVAQLVCPFLCVQLCVFSSVAPPPPSFFYLTFPLPPSSSLSGSLNPSLSTPPSISLSSECLCNSYSYLLVGARIRASLLMCSCSPRGRGDRENILKS